MKRMIRKIVRLLFLGMIICALASCHSGKIYALTDEPEEYFTNKTVLQFLTDIDDFKRAYKYYLIPAFILLFIFINMIIGWEKI